MVTHGDNTHQKIKHFSSHAPFTFRHALVLATGILILLGPCALVYNTWAIFVVPVSASLGATTAQFTLYITVVYLVGAFSAPLAGNLLERFDLRLVLSFSVILVALGIGLCSLWTSVWQFYISGLLEGIGIVSLMFLAVPTLINRWFTIRTGFFIGLCMAMSGFGGALWSMVGGALITSVDWRFAYLVYAGLVLILALPATALFIRSYPRDLGLLPYGLQHTSKEIAQEITLVGDTVVEDYHKFTEQTHLPEASEALQNDNSDVVSAYKRDTREWGVSASVMFRSPVFFILMLTLGLCNALTAVANLFASYIYYLGDCGFAGITPDSAVMMASTVAACLMISAALSKVALGALTDKTSRGALALICGTALVAIICMWQAQLWAFGVYVGAVLFGLMYAAVDSYGPAQTRKLVGPRDYTLIYSRISVFINIAGAVSVALFSLVAEVSWDLEWIVTIGFIAVIFVLGLLVERLGKSLKQTYEEKTT